MKYIMTGHKGLIGEKLKSRLDSDHEMVLGIDQRSGSNILSLPSIKLSSAQKTDIFFHLASHCRINEGTLSPELPHLNNADGTYLALEFCRKNKITKFVYFSSSRVLSPEQNPYTASKMYGELLCEAYRQCYGIDYVILRPSTVYGEHHDITTRLLTKWAINSLAGRKLEIYGDKDKTLDFTHVDDFVDGVMLIINQWDKSKNQSYDISGNDIRNLTDVAKLFGCEPVYKDPEIAQPQTVSIDTRKMRSLGFNPQIRLEEGVSRLIEFYKGEGKRWVK